MAKHLRTSQNNSKASARRRAQTPPHLIHVKKPEKRVFRYDRELSRREIVPLLVSLPLFALSSLIPYGVLRLLAFAVTAVVAALPLLRRTAVRALRLIRLDEDCLALLGALLLFIAGHYATGALVVILARGAQLAQAYVLARSEKGVEAMGDILPEKAHRVLEYGTEDLLPEALRAGDCFVVYPGEAVPVDGEVISGESTVDSSMFGGPEEPQPVSEGSRVLSGTLNVTETLRFRAVHDFEDSGLTRHIHTLAEAGNTQTLQEEQMETISAFVAPAFLALSVIVGLVIPLFRGDWAPALTRAAVLLCLASPAALILTMPVAYLGGLSCASHSGMRLRAKTVLDCLAHVRTVVFGKTGTITDGRYRVTETVSNRVTETVSNRVSREELLRVAAAAESGSRHPIALAIKAAAGWTAEDNEAVLQGEEIPGRGVTCFFEGKQIYVGNAAMLSEHGVWFQVPSRPGAAIHVAVDNVYWGYILMSDKVREGAFDAVEELRSQGMKNVVMLTGDVRSETAKLARSLNFDMVKTELSEEEKLSAVEFLRHGLGKGECLACVGDGFHDAALFKHADIGIALSAMGDDTAEQAADVILMDDDLARIPVAVRIARGTDLLVKESAIALGAIKLLLLVLTLAGVLPAVPAVFVNAAAECLAALNALRGFTLV